MNNITQAKERASALAITMLVIFLVTVSIGIAMNMTTAAVRQTDTSRDFSALRSAAEGALEYGYGVWANRINNTYTQVSNAALVAALGATPPPLPTGFSYVNPLRVQGTDQYGRPDGITPPTTTKPVATRVNLPAYPGWIGTNTNYVASVRVSGTFTGNRVVPYGAKRSISYTVVPLFQATAFFEDDLELYRTAPMTIGGLVHTNSKAYVSSSVDPSSGNPASLTFSGNVSYASGYEDGRWQDADNIWRDAPPEAWNWSGYLANNSFVPDYSNGGKAQQLDQVRRIEPLGSDAKLLLNTADANRNNDTMREMIEPPNTYVDPMTHKITTAAAAADPQPIADRRVYNKAGIRVRVSGSSYTVTTANGTVLTAAQKNALTASLSQQIIYDRREGKFVSLTTLDIDRATKEVTPGVPGPLEVATFNNIIYLDDTSSIGDTDPRGIRLIKGNVLPTDGLTVGSQNAVYIQGDYNTSNQSTRGSAAVFADSVTILSNDWKDIDSWNTLANRKAKDTTVNTAIVAGFLPSGWTDPKTDTQYGYSGGLNNFPRFLEDWSGKKFFYTGSMIELFTSQIATGQWDTGSIYVPPTRIWNFDNNFVDNPPPGSLDAVYIGRGALVRY